MLSLSALSLSCFLSLLQARDFDEMFVRACVRMFVCLCFVCVCVCRHSFRTIYTQLHASHALSCRLNTVCAYTLHGCRRRRYGLFGRSVGSLVVSFGWSAGLTVGRSVGRSVGPMYPRKSRRAQLCAVEGFVTHITCNTPFK